MIHTTPRVDKALETLSLTDPDFTLTEVEVDCFWGPWARDGGGNRGGLSVNWTTKSAGCGRLYLVIDPDGVLRMESQGMDKEFMKAVLAKLVDAAEERK